MKKSKKVQVPAKAQMTKTEDTKQPSQAVVSPKPAKVAAQPKPAPAKWSRPRSSNSDGVLIWVHPNFKTRVKVSKRDKAAYVIDSQGNVLSTHKKVGIVKGEAKGGAATAAEEVKG